MSFSWYSQSRCGCNPQILAAGLAVISKLKMSKRPRDGDFTSGRGIYAQDMRYEVERTMIRLATISLYPYNTRHLSFQTPSSALQQ